MNPLNVDGVSSFSLQWLSWWNSLQPTWRRNTTAGALPKKAYTGDLRSLRKGGPNGFVTALLGLQAWGAADHDSLWLETVRDVRECLTSFLVATGKRKDGPPPSAPRYGLALIWFA